MTTSIFERKKIRAMIDNKPDFETLAFGKLYPECTWPISNRDSGKFKGYIMPQLIFQALQRLVGSKQKIT